MGLIWCFLPTLLSHKSISYIWAICPIRAFDTKIVPTSWTWKPRSTCAMHVNKLEMWDQPSWLPYKNRLIPFFFIDRNVMVTKLKFMDTWLPQDLGVFAISGVFAAKEACIDFRARMGVDLSCVAFLIWKIYYVSLSCRCVNFVQDLLKECSKLFAFFLSNKLLGHM